MRYVLLGYGSTDAFDALGPAERAAWAVDDAAFNADLAERGVVVHGEPLAEADTATTVRVRGGDAVITDGPFAEAAEHLGGFLVIDVPDLDAALDIAGRCPASRTGTIEVRPVRGP